VESGSRSPGLLFWRENKKGEEMNLEQINYEMIHELYRAEKKFPQWPKDPVHGAGIMAEEAGEALQAALDFYYGRGDSKKLKKEIIHTLAMAARFLMNFESSVRWTNIFNKAKNEAEERKEKFLRRKK
jgi:hypothetical protein